MHTGHQVLPRPGGPRASLCILPHSFGVDGNDDDDDDDDYDDADDDR